MLTAETSWMMCDLSRCGYTKMTRLRPQISQSYLSFLQRLSVFQSPAAALKILTTNFKLPLIFTTTLFSAIDVGRLFWIICEPNTCICATLY